MMWKRVLIFLSISLSACSVLNEQLPNRQATQEYIPPTLIEDTTNETPLPSFLPGLIEVTPRTVLPPESTQVPEMEEEFEGERIAPSAGTVVIVPGSTGVWFNISPGDPKVMPNFVETESGCNWMGVGGQVFGLNSEPVTNLVIQLGGNLNGGYVDNLGLTGTAPQLGSGGYLLKISDQPVESNGSIWVALFDVSGIQISNRIYLHTFADCELNFVLLNFKQVDLSALNWFYFPAVFFESP